MKTKIVLIFEIAIIIVVFVFIKDWYQEKNDIYSLEGKLISYIVDSDSYRGYTYDELRNVNENLNNPNFLYMDKFYKLCNNEAVDDFIQNGQYLNYIQVIEGYDITDTEVIDVKMINDRNGEAIGENIPSSVHIRTYSASYKYISSTGQEYELRDLFIVYTDGNKITYVLNKFTQLGVQKMLIDLIY